MIILPLARINQFLVGALRLSHRVKKENKKLRELCALRGEKLVSCERSNDFAMSEKQVLWNNLYAACILCERDGKKFLKL